MSRVSNSENLPSLKLTARTWKWMVGRLVSFWSGLFSGAMLVLGRVHNLHWKRGFPMEFPFWLGIEVSGVSSIVWCTHRKNTWRIIPDSKLITMVSFRPLSSVSLVINGGNNPLSQPHILSGGPSPKYKVFFLESDPKILFLPTATLLQGTTLPSRFIFCAFSLEGGICYIHISLGFQSYLLRWKVFWMVCFWCPNDTSSRGRCLEA